MAPKPLVGLKITFKPTGKINFVKELLEDFEKQSCEVNILSMKQDKTTGCLSLAVGPEFSIQKYGNMCVFKGVPFCTDFEEEILSISQPLRYPEPINAGRKMFKDAIERNPSLNLSVSLNMELIRKHVYDNFTKKSISNVQKHAGQDEGPMAVSNEQEDADRLSSIQSCDNSDKLSDLSSLSDDDQVKDIGQQTARNNDRATVLNKVQPTNEDMLNSKYINETDGNINNGFLPTVKYAKSNSSENKLSTFQGSLLASDKKNMSEARQPGAQLLALISPQLSDYEELNKFAMDALREQIEHLVSIKDTLRLEKRQTKLQRKEAQKLQQKKQQSLKKRYLQTHIGTQLSSVIPEGQVYQEVKARIPSYSDPREVQWNINPRIPQSPHHAINYDSF